ncbi:phosphoribosylamine--glycine ligase [Halarchaeum salinum]|uniref:Phosphoribosylamine--glycine ligase n=1 Tax=Halarchaeum salinum TaxID=489912 RepID=A0AAV3S7U7_9EURY
MTETVLLVGGGGREHAIARALADDCDLYACASNRNPGIVSLAAGTETLDESDPEAVVAYADDISADLAVVGPEGPLAAGVVDALEDAGVYAFGPRQAEARIETDKAFQRSFMAEHDIPGTPWFETFDDAADAADYVESLADEGEDAAVKPTGLTGGKGVRVTGDQVTHAEAADYVRESGHDEWVIEERLVGEEVTIQAFVANGDVRPTLAVQDHKRAYEGDEGPNTGGMGSYSDVDATLPFMTREDYADAVEIIEATVDALGDYRGVLYGQFMLTSDGPKVVEFNARFGDPEAMNTLSVLDTPLVDVLTAAREGETLPSLDFTGEATVCKYAVPEGYPSDPEAGAEVTLDEEGVGDALLFYASVDARDDGVYTTTSRSFAVVGRGGSIESAEAQADSALDGLGSGFRIRHDIGKAALVERRIEHMDGLR